MAREIPCDICQAEPGMMMIGNMVSGDQLSVGAACWESFLTTSLASWRELLSSADAPDGYGEPLATPAEPSTDAPQAVDEPTEPGAEAEVPPAPFPAGGEPQPEAPATAASTTDKRRGRRPHAG